MWEHRAMKASHHTMQLESDTTEVESAAEYNAMKEKLIGKDFAKLLPWQKAILLKGVTL
jgi:hypothetical protein